MATTFYKQTTKRQGNKVIHVRQAMTQSEVKAYVMKANGWTAEQYRKNYDMTKNRLKAYENFKKARGAKVTEQSPVDLLMKQAKAKMLYGPDYKPSAKMQQIQSFSAYSITQGKQRAEKNQKYITKTNQKYGDYVNNRFEGFIKANDGAQKIKQAFEDRAKETGEAINYAKMEEALSDYADKVKAKIDDEEKVQDNEAIPAGERIGSPDTQVDFDVEAYF